MNLDNLMRYAEDTEHSETCLVRMNENDYGIAIIPFPKKDELYSVVSQWENKIIMGVIPLNRGYGLQDIYLSSIKEIEPLVESQKRVAEEMSLKKEDILNPVFGGIIGYDFREFLKRAFDFNGENKYGLFDWTQLYRSYVREILQKIKDSLPLTPAK